MNTVKTLLLCMLCAAPCAQAGPYFHADGPHIIRAMCDELELRGKQYPPIDTAHVATCVRTSTTWRTVLESVGLSCPAVTGLSVVTNTRTGHSLTLVRCGGVQYESIDGGAPFDTDVRKPWYPVDLDEMTIRQGKVPKPPAT